MPVELGMGHKKAVKRTIFTRIQVHRAHMLGFQVQSAAERANLYIGKQAIKKCFWLNASYIKQQIESEDN